MRKSKIKNQKSKIAEWFTTTGSNSCGFTLIEPVVVMAVVIAIGGIGFSIIFSSLRATNKTNTLTSARQNGNYAISQMSKMIRYAKRFDGVSTDDVSYLSTCAVSVGVGTPTPVPAQYHYLKVTSFEDVETKFTCVDKVTSSPSGLISFTAGPLVDTDKIVVDTCYFTCSQTSSSDFPTIGISFSLSQKDLDSLVENKASVNFNTSIVMRNLNK